MILDGTDVFTWSAQTGATLIPQADRRTAAHNPPVNANTGVTATQTVVSDPLTLGGGGVGYTNSLFLQVKYSAAANSSGSNALQFALQESNDGSTWNDRVVSDPVALSTTAQTGAITLQYSGTAKFARLRPVITGTGGGGAVTINHAALVPTAN